MVEPKGKELVKNMVKSIKSKGEILIFDGKSTANMKKNFTFSTDLFTDFEQNNPYFPDFLKEEKQDISNPLIEALFMTMRGHNVHLSKQDEPSNPACAQGACLQLLEALGEVTRNEHIQNAIAGVEIVNCGDQPAVTPSVAQQSS